MTCDILTEAHPQLPYVLRNSWPSVAVKARGAFSRHVNESRKSTWIRPLERNFSSERNIEGRAGTENNILKHQTDKMNASQQTSKTTVKITNTFCRKNAPLDKPFLHNVDGDVYDPYIVIVMTQL